jgi:ketosteroid isomerase-like protein
LTAEDNRVSAVVNGFAKTQDGTEYNNKYHFLIYLRDGKVSKHLEYMDSYLGAKVMGPILQRLLRGG